MHTIEYSYISGDFSVNTVEIGDDDFQFWTKSVQDVSSSDSSINVFMKRKETSRCKSVVSWGTVPAAKSPTKRPFTIPWQAE